MKEEFITLEHYLENLQSRYRYCFLRKEAIAKQSLSDNAFKKAAYRLMQKGKVNRIRGDFYTLSIKLLVRCRPPGLLIFL